MTIPPSLVILHLSLIDHIGSITIERIVTTLSYDNLEQLYDYDSVTLHEKIGIPLKTAEIICTGLANKSLLEEEYERINANGIRVTTFLDEEYPSLLKHIHAPASVLYWKGILPGSHSVAVIGSREANGYGKYAIELLVPSLVEAGFTIVSGGARGADTMAHEATLQAGGTTVAVLGSGLLRVYPPENKKLFDRIVAHGGALVSPFHVRMAPLAQNFPARNRIISGLSKGCVIIQAAIKSGALTTAQFCLSQGRDAFAVPGPIDDPLSRGCHFLIQQGAKLTTNAQDILEEYGIVPSEPSAGIPEIKVLSAGYSPTPDKSSCLSALEKRIWDECTSGATLDHLLDALEIPLVELTPLLFDLQLKGFISQDMAGIWQKQ